MPYRLMKCLLLVVGLLIGLLAFDFIPAQATTQEIYLTAQQYDKGLMIWRSDDSDVWVLLNTQRAYKFTGTSYNRLSDKTAAYVPAGRIRPMSSFGRIWNNLAYIRTALGYPTLPEVGFKSNVSYYPPPGEVVSMPQPDGKVLTVYRAQSGYAWRYGGAPTPKVSTTRAAFQAFDNGYMIWRADTQEVLVFPGKKAGQMSGVLVTLYQTWPDNPVTAAPPAGHVKPANAFGKVWGHMWLANQRSLGWPIAPEQGYTATVTEAASYGPQGLVAYSISIPDGRTINISRGYSYANWDIR